MRDIIFLCHRIPYPPDKGDKIRSWNILSYLSERYRVHLGCFIDDPRDWQYVRELKLRCHECYFAELQPQRARLRSAIGLMGPRPVDASLLPSRRAAELGRADSARTPA